MAVVTHANQQPTAISIGKCRYRLGQFACIRNPIFEVLLLVFALMNEADIACLPLRMVLLWL